MQHDERGPRDEHQDEPSEAPPTPEDQTSDQPAEQLEPRPDDEAEAEDEFETASWPVRDLSAGDAAPSSETDEADAGVAAAAADGAVAAAGAPAGDETPDEPAPDAAAGAGPPPSDVEAYVTPATPTEPMVAAHSVPATEPGESTQCPRCGTENRPGIAFCRNCGQRLVAAGAPTTLERPEPPEGTQACPRCGTHNRAGVAFCQNCGANLRAAAAGLAEDEGRRRTVRVGGRAILGPVVLLIGAIGIATAWLLPFPFGAGSLYDRAYGSQDGYFIAFWTAYEPIEGLASQAYFGFAAPAPILVALLVLLAIGGLLRPAPRIVQLIGLVIALVWAIGLAVLFVVVEVLGGPGGALIDILRNLTPGGIIFVLAGLIVVIGALTRVGRG